MTEINDGDTVRVTFEGKARKDSLGRVFVNDALLSPFAGASSVEILSKRPPQVGDVIASRKGLKKLPELTVVVGSGTPPQRPMIVTRNGTIAVSDGTGDPWVTEGFKKVNGMSAPYTVIYIPSL